MSYSEYEIKVIQWAEARKIIPNSTPAAQWKKGMEEMQELKDAIDAGNIDLLRDAVGDVVVCLINLCALADVDLVECLSGAYGEIKDRKGYMNEEGIFVKETK
jgi:NTP pyrophosphatase (non-canonical NTP hydrolase)